jgi:hypothetical protein
VPLNEISVEKNVCRDSKLLDEISVFVVFEDEMSVENKSVDEMSKDEVSAE